MREAGCWFPRLDFMGLFVELTLLRDDVLAEKLVPWEPMNHDQRLALLRRGPASGLLTGARLLFGAQGDGSESAGLGTRARPLRPARRSRSLAPVRSPEAGPFASRAISDRDSWAPRDKFLGQHNPSAQERQLHESPIKSKFLEDQRACLSHPVAKAARNGPASPSSEAGGWWQSGILRS